MKLVSAQIDCEVGDIQQNLERHYALIDVAAASGARLILFPEMSITGYSRNEASDLAFTEGDTRLDKMRELSSKGNIVIVAGAPIRIDDELYIGAFVIHPNNSVEIYAKQHLHDGEELFFSSSDRYNPLIRIGDEVIALAICADINDAQHAQRAKNNGATVYAAGIFYSTKGMEDGKRLLEYYAKEHHMCVLMPNYCGHHWGMDAGGGSAFWDSDGILHGELEGISGGCVFADNSTGIWKASIRKLDARQ